MARMVRKGDLPTRKADEIGHHITTALAIFRREGVGRRRINLGNLLAQATGDRQIRPGTVKIDHAQAQGIQPIGFAARIFRPQAPQR